MSRNIGSKPEGYLSSNFRMNVNIKLLEGVALRVISSVNHEVYFDVIIVHVNIVLFPDSP